MDTMILLLFALAALAALAVAGAALVRASAEPAPRRVPVEHRLRERRDRR